MPPAEQLRYWRRRTTAELDRLVLIQSRRSLTEEEEILGRELAPIEVLLSIATADLADLTV